MEKYKRRILFNAGKNPYLTLKITEIERNDVVSDVKSLLQNIIKLNG